MKELLLRLKNWFAETVERITKWKSTVPGFIKIIATFLVAINILPPEASEKIMELIGTSLDSANIVLIAIGAILGSILGLMDVWKKE